MSLGFLTISGDGPPARSPLASRSFEGASLIQQDGWEVVASYGDAAAEARACRETVGWADRSHLTKLELSGTSSPLSCGSAERRGEGWLCPITPRRALLLGAVEDPPEGSLLDLTSSLATISVAGPGARETIARFCAIDTRSGALPLGGFRPGSIGRTPGFLLREAEDGFLLLFGAAYGAYMWEIVSDAGTRLGGRPVGAEAGSPSAAREEVAADA
jgi:glycine cleavage system aminomethyltransferase T